MTHRASIAAILSLVLASGCGDSNAPGASSIGPDGGATVDGAAAPTDASSHDDATHPGVDASKPGDAGGGGNTDAAPPDAGPPLVVSWPSAACKAQSASLLAKMTRLQKAGQMVSGVNPATSDVAAHQYGSVLAGGSDMPPTGNAPADWAAMTDGYAQEASSSALAIPIIYALDAVHGNSHPSGTVIFPHAIGLASSRDAALVTQVGQVTASESVATGVTMTYAPQASVAWDARWGRTYETFSEDVGWASDMVAASVIGLQGPMGLGTGTPGMIACAKHWAGDGQATAGTSHSGGVVDRADIRIDTADMQKYGIAPYLPAINAGLGCIMVSDTTWNGAWITSSSQLITTMLKGTYGFHGFVITDWNANVAAGGIEATINAGVDMLMEPTPPPTGGNWQQAVTTIANSSAIPDSRIDDAVTRILNVKCQAGLFNSTRDPSLLAGVGSPEHRALGRKAVAQSLVVLQNDNHVLPLAKGANVWVGGSGASSLTNQCGGWTINWQGNGDATTGTTISQAIGKVATLAGDMNSADVQVVVLSEGPYAETPGDRNTLDTLPASDFALLTHAKATGKPVVAIVMSGRPVLITDALPNADAWIAAWLPGTEGDGVADVLFGDVKPTGKLSHSWRRDDSQANFMTCCNGGASYNPLFPLGFGLTF